MTSHQEQSSFEFYPDWEHLEKFLRLYQEADKSGQRTTLRIGVDPEYSQVLPGYPNTRRNAWINLSYAVAEINRTFHKENSLVDCQIVLRPENEHE